MTTLSAVPPASVRPVPWHRLGWVTWRRQRATIIATAGLLGLVAFYLVITGHRIHTDYTAWQTCTPAHGSACQFLGQNFANTYGSTGFLGFVQVLLPGLVGTFAGAPLLARELETGTYRYAWTQGVGRLRWATAILLPAALWSTTLMAAYGALFAWRNQPLVHAGLWSRTDGSMFPLGGPAVVGWTLAGFALGVLAGLLWQRTVPALATAVVVWFGLAALTATNLRMHYLAPLTTSTVTAAKSQPSQGNIIVADWWTKGGVRVSMDRLNQVLQHAGLGTIGRGHAEHAAPGSGVEDPFQYLAQHGYTHVTSYQPDSRYWTFQWVELGWLAILALALLAATFWLLRRRSG